METKDGGVDVYTSMDPSAQVHLDTVNKLTAAINGKTAQYHKLETDLELLLETSRRDLLILYKSGHRHIERSREYFLIRAHCLQAKRSMYDLTVTYRKACQDLDSAKLELKLIEAAMMSSQSDTPSIGIKDVNILRQLNEASQRVLDTAALKSNSDSKVSKCSDNISKLEARMSLLNKQMGTSIKKAWPYIQMKDRVHTLVQRHLAAMEKCQADLCHFKALYGKELDLQNIKPEPIKVKNVETGQLTTSKTTPQSGQDTHTLTSSQRALDDLYYVTKDKSIVGDSTYISGIKGKLDFDFDTFINQIEFNRQGQG